LVDTAASLDKVSMAGLVALGSSSNNNNNNTAKAQWADRVDMEVTAPAVSGRLTVPSTDLAADGALIMARIRWRSQHIEPLGSSAQQNGENETLRICAQASNSKGS
jgi:hypothetical protein